MIRPPLVFLAAAFMLALVIGCSGERTVEESKEMMSEVDPIEEVRAWQQRRHDSLMREDGWLTLTGLFWLDEGENAVGSDPAAGVVLSESVPAHVATLRREGSRVTLEPAAGVDLRVNGAPAAAGPLASDMTGDPTIVEIGTVRFNVIERSDRVGVRVRDTASPVRANFSGLDYYEFDPRYRVVARFEPYEPAREIPIVNVLDMVEPMVSPGALVFTIDGEEYRLDPVQEEGSKRLFVIFADETNRTETYPAGRYVYTDLAVNGEVLLDFNQSYNPPCAFTDFATCPLPPRQNRLAVAIPAGEKRWADAEH